MVGPSRRGERELSLSFHEITPYYRFLLPFFSSISSLQNPISKASRTFVFVFLVVARLSTVVAIWQVFGKAGQLTTPYMMEIHEEDAFDSLDHDVTVRILMCLDNPGDIARASSVSRSWRDLIISNAVCKKLCLKLFPQLSGVINTVDSGNKLEKPAEVGCSSSNDWEHAMKEHRIYVSLAQNLMAFEPGGCIADAKFASSTDNYPEESILNTLDRRDRVGHRASYWSSSGQSDPSVPETLTYKLVSSFCVVSEIIIQPFEAYFQPNFPIYSAKAVRFRMGHQIVPDCEIDLLDGPTNGKQSAEDKFVWTYTSPEFPMAQECTLQHFKLPHPVLCIGGIFQIELLSRVQTQEMDGLYYICVTHVDVLGRSLWPVFAAEIVEPSGRFTLKYNPQAQLPSPSPVTSDDTLNNMTTQILTNNVRGWEQILNILRGNLGVEVFLSDDEHNDSDDEFFQDFAA